MSNNYCIFQCHDLQSCFINQKPFLGSELIFMDYDCRTVHYLAPFLRMEKLKRPLCWANVKRFYVMMLSSQSEEPIHFHSESANKNCTQIKTNVERFCVITLSSQSGESIHFQSESANTICAQIKTNVERFSVMTLSSHLLSKWIDKKMASKSKQMLHRAFRSDISMSAFDHFSTRRKEAW